MSSEIKCLLSKYFHGYTNNLTSIIFDYSGHYFKFNILTNLTLSKITTIIELTNNRIAIGYGNGTIIIYNLIDKSTITRNLTKKAFNHSITSVSALCQINEETLACGFPGLEYLLIWNFKTNNEYTIKLIIHT